MSRPARRSRFLSALDAGAEIAGGSKRGTAEAVTLIGADGRVAVTERFDRSATLPSGF